MIVSVPEESESDVYCQLRNWGDPEFPVLQFLKYSHNGWLLEAIDILADGTLDFKPESKDFPLSIAPLEPEELEEEEWAEGQVIRITAVEYNSIKNLALRAKAEGL